MKAKFICRACQKENEFETEGKRTLLVEEKNQPSQPTTYTVDCSYCGQANNVTVWE